MYKKKICATTNTNKQNMCQLQHTKIQHLASDEKPWQLYIGQTALHTYPSLNYLLLPGTVKKICSY